MTGPASAGALSGVRVISIGHTLPGMYCCAILRDLGADITRVEPAAVAGAAPRFAGLAGEFPTRSLLAGTSHCEIDLKQEGGRQLYQRLTARADVVLEGFRPGTAARLGIDYPALAARAPRLVYAAISGYGQEGPAHDQVGHDINYLAMTGVLELTGEPDGPPAIPGVTLGDGLAGMSAAVNVLAALQQRAQTGHGQYLDIAIVDGPLFLMSMEFEHYWQTGHARRRGDSHLTGRYPWYHVFQTKDGLHLSVGAVEHKFYATLCLRLGHPELADRQFAQDAELDDVFRIFRATFKTRTRDEWIALLAGDDVCVAPVLTPGEAADATQSQRMRWLHPGSPQPIVRSPVRLPVPPLPPARDTSATLASYGVSPAEIALLAEQRVIGPLS